MIQQRSASCFEGRALWGRMWCSLPQGILLPGRHDEGIHGRHDVMCFRRHSTTAGIRSSVCSGLSWGGHPSTGTTLITLARCSSSAIVSPEHWRPHHEVKLRTGGGNIRRGAFGHQASFGALMCAQQCTWGSPRKYQIMFGPSICQLSHTPSLPTSCPL